MSDEQYIDISDLLAEHESVKDIETDGEGDDINFDAELEMFLQETQEPVNLLPEEQEEKIVYPYLLLDKLAAPELEVYKKEGLFHNRPSDSVPGSLIQLCVRLEDELVCLGWVEVRLRTFLLIKKLCSVRKLFIFASETEATEITMEHLSNSYLLEVT